MSTHPFQSLLAWAKSKGLELHPALERTSIAGVAGMIARQNIPKGALLASMPKVALIQPEQENCPPDASLTARYLLAAAKAWREPSSDFTPIFAMFDNQEALRQYATLYITADELDRINEASPLLAAHIAGQQQRHNSLIDALVAHDPDISRAVYEQLLMAYDSRAMGQSGFVPVVDCFNHHDELGALIDTSGDRVELQAAVDIASGEQAYMSYGDLDIYTHAVNYHYYDPDAQHRLRADLHLPIYLPAATSPAALRAISSQMHMQVRRHPAGLIVNLQEPKAFLTMQGPSTKLLQCLDQLSAGLPTLGTGEAILATTLQQAARSNNIEGFTRKYFPKRYKRFYDVLLRERDIIKANQRLLQL